MTTHALSTDGDNEPIEAECDACGSLVLDHGDGNFEPVERDKTDGDRVWAQGHTSGKRTGIETCIDIVEQLGPRSYTSAKRFREAVLDRLRAALPISDDTYEQMKAGIGPSGERGIQKL